MSALLDAVAEARELRQTSEREFRSALVEAREQHTVVEIAHAAGITRQGVSYLLRRERGEKR
jgi:hypothetical protein